MADALTRGFAAALGAAFLGASLGGWLGLILCAYLAFGFGFSTRVYPLSWPRGNALVLALTWPVALGGHLWAITHDRRYPRWWFYP